MNGLQTPIGHAPQTPPWGFQAPPTPPSCGLSLLPAAPTAIRELPAFLNPEVRFAEAVTGRRLVLTARTIFGVKQEVANMWHTGPLNVFLVDGEQSMLNELRDSFAEEVTVYVHRTFSS